MYPPEINIESERSRRLIHQYHQTVNNCKYIKGIDFELSKIYCHFAQVKIIIKDPENPHFTTIENTYPPKIQKIIDEYLAMKQKLMTRYFEEIFKGKVENYESWRDRLMS